MAKCAYCAEPLPDSDDEECDEGKEEDDGGCGEGGFCDDFCREMKEDDRRWDQETLGFSLSEQLAKACFLGNESRVEKLLSKGAPVSQAVPGAIAASLGCALRLTPLAAACMAPNDEIGQTFGIVQKLFDCGADSHTSSLRDARWPWRAAKLLAWQDTMRVGLFEWQRGLDSVYSKKSFPRSPQKCGISEAACAERRCHAPVDTRLRARRHRKWIAGLATKGKGTVATPPEGMPSTGFPRGSRFGVVPPRLATGPRPKPAQ